MFVTETKRVVMVLLTLTVLTGVVYPLLVTGLGLVLWPSRARGSLIEENGRVAGSELVGQPFDDPGYFWPRPSATAPFPSNPGLSVGSNLSPADPRFAEEVKRRIALLRKSDPGNQAPVPIDLVTASGSGLDPHLSPAAVEFQIPRVARARGMDQATLRRLLAQQTESPDLGFLGASRVNILQLNLALRQEAQKTRPAGEKGIN